MSCVALIFSWSDVEMYHMYRIVHGVSRYIKWFYLPTRDLRIKLFFESKESHSHADLGLSVRDNF